MASDEQVPKPSWWFVLPATFAGAVAGGLVGAFFGYVSYQPSGDWIDFGPGFNTMFGAACGVPVGALLAAIGWTVWRVRL